MSTHTATWNGVLIAESSDTVIVDGNHYFPIDSVKDKSFLVKNSSTSSCPYKGTANYFDIHAGGKVNAGACWYYATPKDGVKQIKDRMAFWKGVQVK